MIWYKILLALITFNVSFAFAKDMECQSKIGKRSICSIAKEISTEMAKELPMQINKDFTIEKSFHYKNTVTTWGRFNFNEKALTRYLLKTKISQNDFQEKWRVQAKRGICESGSASREFITSGGVMQYSYVFKDNTPYMTFDIEDCKSVN